MRDDEMAIEKHILAFKWKYGNKLSFRFRYLEAQILK